MHSPKHNDLAAPRRRASLPRAVWGMTFILLGLLSQHENAGAPIGPVSAPAAASASGETYYVDWNITASGDRADTGYTIHHRISIVGSAVVHRDRPPDGPLTVLPFQLTVTDDYEQHTIPSDNCTEDYRWTITDPARWMGGPDPFWRPWDLKPEQRPDGSWYMHNPLDIGSFVAGYEPTRYFAYRFDYISSCWPNSDYTYTSDEIFYSNILGDVTFRLPPLEGDSLGTTFSLNKTYTYDFGYHQLMVNFQATVRRACGPGAPSAQASSPGVQGPLQVCGCASLPPGTVIDANDPIITHHEVSLDYSLFDSTSPDGELVLLGRVMCDGRRVKNAELELTVKPEERSGGHLHDSSNPPRPRGYLNGTEITKAKPSIKLRSDSQGVAYINFRPGKDLSQRIRGIAGIYVVKARSTRFPESQDELNVRVAVPGLIELRSGTDFTLFADEYALTLHTSNFFATPGTSNALREFAAHYAQRQYDHNRDLLFYGEQPWPIVKPVVRAISLEDGGLFEVWAGVDSWKPPFYRHLWGDEVVFWGYDPPGFDDFPVPEKRAIDWLNNMTLELGTEYGTWFQDYAPYHLALAPLGVTRNNARPLNGPDLGVVAFLSEPEERLAAAPGQTVTYTVGLHNLDGGAPASNAILTATLPAGLNFISAQPPATRMAGANQPVWAVGTVLTNTLTPIFNITTQIGTGVTHGTVLTVTAQASTSDTDANLANNYAEAFGLLVQPPGPDLTVSSDLEAVAMTIGKPITFTIQVDNMGNAPATSSALTLTLPVSVTLTRANPITSTGGSGSFVWNLGTLPPTATQQVTVTVNLDPRLVALVPLDPDIATGGILTYTLGVGSAAADIAPANNVEQVSKRIELPGPDLNVSLGVLGASGPGTLAAGQDVTYTIGYGNFGNQVASSTTVTLSLWAGLSLVSAQPAPSQTMTSTTFAGGVAGWNLGTVNVGDDGTIQVRVHVNSVAPTGSLVLATITSGGRDIHPTNNASLDRRWAAVIPNFVYLPLIQR